MPSTTSAPARSGRQGNARPFLGLTLRSYTRWPTVRLSRSYRPSSAIPAWHRAACCRAAVATFTENKGRWPENVLFRALFPGGAVFVEERLHLLFAGAGRYWPTTGTITRTVRTLCRTRLSCDLEGASRADTAAGEQTDPTRTSSWKRRVAGACIAGSSAKCDPSTLYQDRPAHRWKGKGLKYEFIVAAGSWFDPHGSKDRMTRALGECGRLVVTTSAGRITEEAPVWVFPFSMASITNGCRCLPHLPFEGRHRLRSRWGIQGRHVDHRPRPHVRLVQRSAANNFGFTATYDGDGAFTAGHRVRVGYPVTLGVQQGTFAGNGDIDIGISADGVAPPSVEHLPRRVRATRRPPVWW